MGSFFFVAVGAAALTDLTIDTSFEGEDELAAEDEVADFGASLSPRAAMTGSVSWASGTELSVKSLETQVTVATAEGERSGLLRAGEA